MFTIYYHPRYWRRKRIFLTRNIKYSKFLTLFEYISWKLKKPLPDNFIYSGPHKLINNLHKIFNQEEDVSFNDFKFENSYIVQFDKYGQEIYKHVLEKKPNSKIIIGPLIGLEKVNYLINILKNNHNLKILVASQMAKQNAISLGFKSNQLVVWPVGVASQKYCLGTRQYKKNLCLIYVKNRDPQELEEVKKVLEINSIKFKIFNYGNYKNSDLKKFAKKSEFGIVLTKTESQGIAVQELMSAGLPLIVNGEDTNFWGEQILEGTPTPYWSEYCGLKLDSIDNFEEVLRLFLKNINTYNPRRLIIDELTFEKTGHSLKQLFINS